MQMNLKTKLIMVGFMFAFMIAYAMVFGSENAAIGMMIVMAH